MNPKNENNTVEQAPAATTTPEANGDKRAMKIRLKTGVMAGPVVIAVHL